MYADAHGCRKRVLDPLEVEVQTNMGCWSELPDVGAGNSVTPHVLFATRDKDGTNQITLASQLARCGKSRGKRHHWQEPARLLSTP